MEIGQEIHDDYFIFYEIKEEICIFNNFLFKQYYIFYKNKKDK